MDYLHYYLIHSSDTMSFVHAIELGKRQELIDRQIETLRLRGSYIASSVQGIEELGQIWDELTGDTNILKSSFEDNPPQTLTLSLGGHTLGNLGYSKHGAAELAAEIGKNVDKLQEMTTEFSSALLRTLDEVYAEVSSDGNFEQFRREIIEEYRKNKGLRSFVPTELETRFSYRLFPSSSLPRGNVLKTNYNSMSSVYSNLIYHTSP